MSDLAQPPEAVYVFLLLPSMKRIRALFSVGLDFCFVKPQLELVSVTRETSRHRPRRHPGRRGLAQTERLRAGYLYYS